ncbi:unnamed protein product [Moneuplotes crassus]|uniref:Uncharacterized protein n=1 Tax=Euplotes crassus TaxID=5936 RepID=A0AAD1UGY1_EUPCR|nr:unnamed protein product [Moneuplotes crassus]
MSEGFRQASDGLNLTNQCFISETSSNNLASSMASKSSLSSLITLERSCKHIGLEMEVVINIGVHKVNVFKQKKTIEELNNAQQSNEQPREEIEAPSRFMVGKHLAPKLVNNFSQTNLNHEDFGNDSISKKMSNRSSLASKHLSRTMSAGNFITERAFKPKENDIGLCNRREETKEEVYGLEDDRQATKENKNLNMNPRRITRNNGLNEIPIQIQKGMYVFNFNNGSGLNTADRRTRNTLREGHNRFSNNTTGASTSRLGRSRNYPTTYYEHIKQRSISRASRDSFNSLNRSLKKPGIIPGYCRNPYKSGLASRQKRSSSVQELYKPHKLRVTNIRKISNGLVYRSKFLKRY